MFFIKNGLSDLIRVKWCPFLYLLYEQVVDVFFVWIVREEVFRRLVLTLINILQCLIYLLLFSLFLPSESKFLAQEGGFILSILVFFPALVLVANVVVVQHVRVGPWLTFWRIEQASLSI